MKSSLAGNLTSAEFGSSFNVIDSPSILKGFAASNSFVAAKSANAHYRESRQTAKKDLLLKLFREGGSSHCMCVQVSF